MKARQSALETTELRCWTASEATPTVDPRLPSPEPDERGWIGHATSWLFDCMTDSFAAYGQAMYPCPIDLGGDCQAQTDDWRLPATRQSWSQETPPPRHAVTWHGTDIQQWLLSARSEPPRPGGRWRRFARLLPICRAWFRQRRWSRELERLDDRLLRDIGLERHEINRIS